jgi:4-amino-4-deoxy-L-arabinose transferase-like glycosyltransferase
VSPSRKHYLTLGILCTVLVVLLVLKPAEVPPIWYDEGWVLSIARNWVERGHYGHLRLGEPVPAGIPYTGMPAVAPLALSFRLFGIGPWQARLPGICFTFGALAALYFLALRLYDRSVALGTLAVSLLLLSHPDLHPVLVGRQAVGEMPAMLLLLAGFLAFTWAWKRPLWSIPLAILCWALALRTKSQILPFLFAGLAFPLAIALWQRRWRTARILASGLLGALVTSTLLGWGQELLLRSPLFAPSSGHDLYSWLDDASDYLFTHVFVPNYSVRLTALIAVLVYSVPVVLGLGYAARRFAVERHAMDLDRHQDAGRLILWTFAVSWLAWYLLFSQARGAYLFPPVFVSSVFVALLLRDLAGGLNLPRLLRQGIEVLKQRRFTLPGIGVLLTAVLIPAAFFATVIMLFRSYLLVPGDSLFQTARFLNTKTEPGALIETYDVELFFLLQRPYHFPPDPVQNQLNRRLFRLEDNLLLGGPERDAPEPGPNQLEGRPSQLQDVVIDYDPLSANPDFIVVGPHSRMWQLYDPVLEAGAFRPVFTSTCASPSTCYQVYERVRH